MNNLLKKAIVMGLGALAGVATLSATRIDDGAWLNKKDDDKDNDDNIDDAEIKEMTAEEKVSEDEVIVKEETEESE